MENGLILLWKTCLPLPKHSRLKIQKTIQEIQDAIVYWNDQANKLNLPVSIIQGVKRDFVRLL